MIGDNIYELVLSHFGLYADSDNIEVLVTELANLNRIRTYSITYAENGAFTTINSNDGEPLIFEAGSLGKPITAYLCMKLVKEGKKCSFAHFLNSL